MSIEYTNVRRTRDDKSKKNRTKNGPRVSRIDPSEVPAALFIATRMAMNLAPIDPANNPDVTLKRNPSGFVTTPRNTTVSRLGKKILYPIIMCSYCWKPGDLLLGPDGIGWTVDHVIPHCKGGIENLSNLVKCCWTCNKWKARRIIAPHPQSAWAAPTATLGLTLWRNASEIRNETQDIQPYVMEFATEEEMTILTEQWSRTQPV